MNCHRNEDVDKSFRSGYFISQQISIVVGFKNKNDMLSGGIRNGCPQVLMVEGTKGGRGGDEE